MRVLWQSLVNANPLPNSEDAWTEAEAWYKEKEWSHKESFTHPGQHEYGSGEDDWPTFNSEAELSASPWAAYFKGLYGELPTALKYTATANEGGLVQASYPLRLLDFWAFYMDKMSAAGIVPPASVGTCPTGTDAPEGQRYDENNAYSSKDLTWLWHPLNEPVPYKGFAANSVVEVSHQKDPFGDEHNGMWFVYAKGSGVYLNLGKTKVFDDHEDAFQFFCGKQWCDDDNEELCRVAASQGYDTIQFIMHGDSVNYPCADETGLKWLNMEIVAVGMVGTYACGQKTGTSPLLRAGWNGDKVCKCDQTNPNTNCVFS